MTLRQTLEQLARDISKRAGEAATPFAESVDALKALTALYGTLAKDKTKPDDDESNGFTMADARSSIEEAHDTSPVRGRRGRATQ